MPHARGEGAARAPISERSPSFLGAVRARRSNASVSGKFPTDPCRRRYTCDVITPPPPRPPRGVLAHIPTRCQLPHTTKEKERHVYHTGYYNTRGAVEVVLLLTHVFLGTTYRIISCSLIVHARGTHVLGIVPYTGIYFYLCKRVTLFGRTR